MKQVPSNSNIDAIVTQSVENARQMVSSYTDISKIITSTADQTKNKNAVTEGLVQISTVYVSISKLIENIAKAKYGNFAKARANIKLFSSNVNVLFNAMIQSLSDMSKNLNAAEIKALMGEETTKKILEFNDLKRQDKNFKEGQLTSIKETEMLKRAENTSSKNYGILDVFERFITIIGSITSFKAPSFTSLFVELEKTNLSLDIFINSLKELITKFNGPEFNKENLELFSDKIDLIKSVVFNIKETFEDFSKIGNPKYIILLTLSRLNLIMLKWIVTDLFELVRIINSEQADEIEDKVSDIVKCVSSVRLLVEEIVSIGTYLALMTIVFIPAILGLVVSTIFIFSLVILIKNISILGTVLENTNFDNIRSQLANIRSIIFDVDLIMVALVLTLPLAGVVLKNFIFILATITAIMLIVAAVGLLLLAYKAVETLIGGELNIDNPTGSATFRTMLCITGTIWALELVLLALVAMQYTAQLIDYSNLLTAIGYVFASIIAIIGISFAVGNPVVSSMILTATIVFVAMNIMVISLITLTMLLIVFGELDMKELTKSSGRSDVKTGHELTVVEWNAHIVTETVKNISNEIWDAYTSGPGIIKTAIVAVWLVTSLLTIGAMILVAGALWLLNKIAVNLDETSVLESVNKIMNLSRHIVDVAIGGKGIYQAGEDGKQEPKSEDVGFIDRLISIGGGILEIAKSLLAFANIAVVALSVAVLWGISAMLNKIAEFNVDETTINEKIEKILSCANHVKDVVFAPSENVSKKLEEKGAPKWLANLSGKAAGMIKGAVNGIGGLAAAGVLAAVLPAVSQVATLVDLLTQIEKFELKEDDIVGKVKQIVRISNLVVENVSTGENVPYSIDKKKVSSYGTYVDDSVKLMKQINKLDTDKLVKYSDMWGKMTEFMTEIKNLNIEELSDAIVNKIAPAMEGISDNVDKMSAEGSKKDISAAANPSTTVPNTPQPTDAQTKLPPEKPKDYTDILMNIKNLLEEYLES